MDRDSSVAVAAFRRYADAEHAREWTVAEGAAGTGVAGTWLGLLRARGQLGEVTVIPAAAPGRRAPAYPAGDPRASAEELLGLAAPARRG